MYDGFTRLLLATELADAFLRSPWRADLVAESGAGCLDRWPPWMDALSLSVVAAYRSPPADERSSLVTFIERFLARRRDAGEGSEPPQILRRQALERRHELRTIQAHFWLGRQLVTPHLPQGAPTSPALANLAAFRLDRRLSGLAAASGLGYSRYADDITFSGSAELTRRRRHLEELASRIVSEEGLALNRDKSALSTAGSRQSVCGVVVNSHPNVTRAEYERLKAILHNATRLGPSSQNRSGMEHFEAHLRGRISWVSAVNPRRGEKLSRRFAEIDWSR